MPSKLLRTHPHGSIRTLEKIRSRLLKNILSLPWSTCTALLFLPATSLGCELRSLIPAYVQGAGQSLSISLADKGSYNWLELWRAVELEWTNNDANGLSFPEYQLVTQFLGICIGQCWPLSDYVATSTRYLCKCVRMQVCNASECLQCSTRNVGVLRIDSNAQAMSVSRVNRAADAGVGAHVARL